MMSATVLVVWLLLVASLGGCSETPPAAPSIRGEHGAYVLCEGLWGHNNATLARIELPSGSVIPDVLSGTGYQLGDVGNDMKRHGDTLYVVISGSRTIECFHVRTARWIGRIRLEQNLYPRQLCIVNDTVGLVTDLYGDAVTAIHLRALRELPLRYPTGPAPEGISAWGDMVFVANSGYGDYRASEPLAGTVTVFSLQRHEQIAVLPAGPNVVTVTVHPERPRLYAVYLHLPSAWRQDSIGGIVEYELPSLRRLRTWRAPVASYDVAWSLSGDTLFFLAPSGVWGIRVCDTATVSPFLVWENPQPRYDNWYTVAVDGAGNLWVGNARTFTVAGEVLYRQNAEGQPRRFAVGVNPGSIVFF